MPDAVRFTETMAGWVSSAVDRDHEDAANTGRTSGSSVLFTLTVVTPDAEAMAADPLHRNPTFGVVLIPDLHPGPLGVVHGALELFVDAAPGVVHMRYGLPLVSADGQHYFLRGIKEVVRRRPWPTVLTDTTTLFVDIYAGDRAEGAPIRRGLMTMGPGGVSMQGLSFRGVGGWWGLRGIVTFMRYYIGRVWGIYLGPRTAPIRPEWSRR